MLCIRILFCFAILRLIFRNWCSIGGGPPEPVTSEADKNRATRLKKADGIENRFELIYKPPNNGLLLLSTSFCTVTCVLCPTMLSKYFYDYANGINTELTAQVSNLELFGVGSISIFSLFVIYICTSIPLRMYNHEKEYVLNSFNVLHKIFACNQLMLLFIPTDMLQFCQPSYRA